MKMSHQITLKLPNAGLAVTITRSRNPNIIDTWVFGIT